MGLSGNVIIFPSTIYADDTAFGNEARRGNALVEFGRLFFPGNRDGQNYNSGFPGTLTNPKGASAKGFQQGRFGSSSYYLYYYFAYFTGTGFWYGRNYCHNFAFNVVYSGLADKASFMFDSSFHSCRSNVDFV
jgi:hypothetical protein